MIQTVLHEHKTSEGVKSVFVPENASNKLEPSYLVGTSIGTVPLTDH